jgi:hypothetical protein
MFATTRILAAFFLLGFLLASCRSAQKFIENGDYDAAIEFCVGKLRGKSKKKTEYVRGLEQAFARAQVRDLQLVENLLDEDRPENWEKINAVHRRIKNRQQKISPLTPLVSKDGYRAKFNFIDIEKQERESREKAAECLYVRAQELLQQAERGDRMAAREAYKTLRDLESRYYRSYKDKDKLLSVARDLGTTRILFEVQNHSNAVLPRGFMDEILNISKRDLDSDWKAYYFKPVAGETYAYKAVFRVTQIDISPERVHERSYTDEKEIQDGWEYVLDSKGNVMKDSLGNDIKKPRKVIVRADVLEVFQSKAARLSGVVEIYNTDRNARLDSKPLSTEILFENYASTFKGDRRALSEESKRRIGNSPMPFPRNEDMLVQAAERLKPNLRDELRRSRVIL